METLGLQFKMRFKRYSPMDVVWIHMNDGWMDGWMDGLID